MAFVKLCRNLLVLQLESALAVDNTAFSAILSHCPGLQQLTVTGHDKGSGNITNKALLPLIEDRELPRLAKLVLTDQREASQASSIAKINTLYLDLVLAQCVFFLAPEGGIRDHSKADQAEGKRRARSRRRNRWKRLWCIYG